MTLTNVTIAGNSAASNGGGGIANGGTATLNNTIVANNSGGDIDFGTVSGANNLIGDAANAGGLSNGSQWQHRGRQPAAVAAGQLRRADADHGLAARQPGHRRGQQRADPRRHPPPTSAASPRVVNGTVDIGAFESSGFTLAVVAGNNQSTTCRYRVPDGACKSA